MRAEEVHADGRHRIMRFPAPSGGDKARLLVSFESTPSMREEFSPPRYPRFAERLGMAVLTVQTRRRDWFISPQTVDLATALAGLSKPYQDVTSTGFSMGAYAALMLSRVTRARRVLAVSPQFSLDPRVAPFDQGRHGKFLRIGHNMPQPQEVGDTKVEGALIYDPVIATDRAHAALVAQHFPRLRRIALPYGGHPATGPLADRGQLGRVAELISSDQLDAQMIRQVYRSVRRASPRYQLNLALALSQRHPKRAAPELTRIAAAAFLPPHLRFEAGLRLLELDHPRAPQILHRLLAQTRDPPASWLRRIRMVIGAYPQPF